MRILDCEQGSEEWHLARAGLVTASNFHAILAKGEGKTRGKYMRQLAGEIITGQPMESYSNGYMDRGKVMEDSIRKNYAFQQDVEPQKVGFIVNGPKGASPDSLIGADGALEIKSKSPDLLIEVLFKDEFPPEHKAQCQGVLWVAEREWIDIAVGYTGMPLIIKRAYRDTRYILDLQVAVDRFNEELHELVAKVRAYGSTDIREAA